MRGSLWHGEPLSKWDALAEADAGVDRRVERWAAAVPRRMSGARLDLVPDAQREAITGWLRGYTAGDRGSLIVTGPLGTGKTFAGYAALRHLHLAGVTVDAVSVPALLDGLRPGGHADMDTYITPDVLLLDDLAAEKPTEWAAERLYLIVDQRWEDMKPCIVTTNLPVDVLREAKGTDRVMSRLAHDATVVRFAGASLR